MIGLAQANQQQVQESSAATVLHPRPDSYDLDGAATRQFWTLGQDRIVHHNQANASLRGNHFFQIAKFRRNFLR